MPLVWGNKHKRGWPPVEVPRFVELDHSQKISFDSEKVMEIGWNG